MAALGSRLQLGSVRYYNAKPFWRQLGGFYRPDPNNPRTPPWQLTAAYELKLFGRYGAASGVDPSRLWPTPEQLQQIEADERERFPSLKEMQMALDKKEQEAEAKKRQREELIAAKMAKMPQMIAAWKQEKKQRKIKEREEKERRQLLLAEARERFGYNIQQYSPEFQEMVQEREKARRKELKALKKQQREEAVARKEMERAALLQDKEGEVVVPGTSQQVIESVGS
uniref:Large ribosomal subunit protein mL64 n=1 Tax=Salvator merianae TaxID=96440 RepID=A0A8D0B5G0_SALMN